MVIIIYYIVKFTLNKKLDIKVLKKIWRLWNKIKKVYIEKNVDNYLKEQIKNVIK